VRAEAVESITRADPVRSLAKPRCVSGQDLHHQEWCISIQPSNEVLGFRGRIAAFGISTPLIRGRK
jgi:hypothetical protein